MRLSSHRSSGGRALISLTPLIDVVFILLVFFMLASNLTRWTTVDLETAAGRSAAPSTEAAVVLSLRDDGTLEWGGAAIDPETLESRLAEVAATDAERRVVVRPDAGVPLQRVVTVLDGVGRAGLTRVTLVRGSGT